MAFTGVNRANVAVTDTFDTWRIRTNEVNTTLNLAAAANTADTLVYRDNAGSANLNVLNANTTVVTHTGTTDSALSVVSAVAAHSGGSYASILTTGGIYGTLSSKFAADLTIGTDLTINGNTALGSSASADEVTFNSTLSGDILPTVTSGAATITAGAATGSDLGATANSFAHIYTVQETISATSGVTTNVFSVTSAAGAGNTATFLNNSATTGTVLSVTSTSTDTTARKLVQITNDAAAAVATTALSIQSDGGRGIFIDSNLAAGLPALEIDSEHETANTVIINADPLTTASAIQVSADGLTTGKMLCLESTSSSTATRSLSHIWTYNSAATGTTALHIQSDAGRGIFVDSNLAAGLPSLEIDSEHTTANTVIIKSDILSTGSALQVSSTGTHSSNLVSFVSDGAATGPTLHLRSDASSGTVKVLQVANSTADIFSVTQAGDATVGNDLTISGDFVVTGNLSVAGATTELNTATTLVRDKTLVLGVKDGGSIACTFDSHASAPTFTTVGAVAHGLSASDVIFISVTGSADNGVTSEALYTVATAANSTIFTLSGTIDTQAGTRTLQFSGPQTDALIDDAGIYLPGSTEIHSFKWDNTDKYWETTDSLFINDTGQLVLPKGTTAQKPAAAATATVPAATTGAIRYNSDTSKVEAVLTSTSYENMSTETFATAIAIALG